MALSSAERAALLNFLGFGNPQAPVVFIGMVEDFGEPPGLEEQLRVRASFRAEIVDLAVAARAHPMKYLRGARPPIQRTWNIAIRVLLAREGNRAPTNDDVRFYQRDRLGRATETAALLELMPLPATSVEKWQVREIFPEIAGRGDYVRSCLERRLERFRQHLGYGPDLVVAYGTHQWEHYRRLYPSVERWAAYGPFACADVGATRVVLAPHFTARTMNGHRDTLIALATRAPVAATGDLPLAHA